MNFYQNNNGRNRSAGSNHDSNSSNNNGNINDGGSSSRDDIGRQTNQADAPRSAASDPVQTGQTYNGPDAENAQEGRPQSPPPQSDGSAGWQNDPSLKNMDLKKLAFLTELVSQSGGKSADTLLPFLISANQNANSMGLQFTNNETDLILNVLKSRMSPEEQARIEMFRKMADMLGKRQ